jgi:cysteine desulfurase
MSRTTQLREGPAYLDYNATTPVDPDVVDAMLPFFTARFGNPSSSHEYGRVAARAVDVAREQVAALIGADPADIVFTGPGSEANTLALRGAMLPALDSGRNHLVTQTTEHPSILETAEALKRQHGIDVTYLPVDGHGRVDPERLRSAVTDRTALVSIQHANGETGTIQPVAELADIAHDVGALFHTDASQSAGKIQVGVTTLGTDLLTLAGHKFYAPKGIAALHLPVGLHLDPLIRGGGQEHRRRAGTENVPAIVGLGAASTKAQALLGAEIHRLARLRDALRTRLGDAFPGRTVVNGAPARRLPNTLNISIDGLVAAEVLQHATDLAASTASACHEGTHLPSEVLIAMGLSRQRALAAFRLSLGRWSDESDVERAVRAISEAAAGPR